MRIEVLVDVKTTLGEGPLWDVEEQRLYWIDIAGMMIYRCTDDGREIRAWDLPQKIGSMALRRSGGAVLSLARGFHFFDFKTGEVELIVDPEPDKPNNRLNDGKVDKRGRFIAGSMDTMEESKNGALYRLDPDLSVHKIEDEVACLMARAGARMPACSTLPTAGRERSGPTTMMSTRAAFLTDGPSSGSIPRAAAPPTARPWMPRAASLERPDLGGQDRPLPAHRRGRSGDRHAG